MNNYDPFGAHQLLNLERPVSYYRLSQLENIGMANISKLPYTIKILLESLLRNCDGFAITQDHVLSLANWQAHGVRQEIPYKPARVVLISSCFS